MYFFFKSSQTITTTTTSYDSAVAGIVVVTTQTPEVGKFAVTAANSIGTRNWTWLQTYGKSEVTLGDTVAVKDALGTSTRAGQADGFLASASVGTAQGNAGFFYDAAAGAADGGTADVECFVRLD